MIKAVIFDMDGVLADSEPLSSKSSEIVLAKYGIKKTDQEKKEAFGRRADEIFGDIIRVRKMKIDIPKLVKEKDETFAKLIRGNLKPIRNSLELVDFFKEMGFKVALATSSHLEKMDPELKELGIEDLFETKISGDEVNHGKPNPEIFLKAAKKLGVKPDECAVIEDSEFGVRAAKNAGMFCIGFKSPNSPNQDLSPADIVVDDLSKIRNHF